MILKFSVRGCLYKFPSPKTIPISSARLPFLDSLLYILIRAAIKYDSDS